MTATQPTHDPLPRPFRLLFVGACGHHYLRQLLGRHDLVEAAALIDPHDADAARGWAERQGVAQTFESWDAAMDWQPHAASVGVVYGKIGDEVAEALRRGLRVVSDKPVAATRDQLAAIASSAAGGVLLTEFDMRCRPAFRAARQAVASGRIGEPLLATAQKSYILGTRPAFFGDPDLATGLPLWVMSHAVDCVRHVAGRDLRVDAGLVGPPASQACRGMQACSAATFRLGDAGVAACHADYLRPGNSGSHGDDRLRVAGTSGVVEVREGRCLLLDGTGPAEDVTDRFADAPGVADELLAALDRPGAHQLFHTADSLEVARLLLDVHDACAS